MSDNGLLCSVGGGGFLGTTLIVNLAIFVMTTEFEIKHYISINSCTVNRENFSARFYLGQHVVMFLDNK